MVKVPLSGAFGQKKCEPTSNWRSLLYLFWCMRPGGSNLSQMVCHCGSLLKGRPDRTWLNDLSRFWDHWPNRDKEQCIPCKAAHTEAGTAGGRKFRRFLRPISSQILAHLIGEWNHNGELYRTKSLVVNRWRTTRKRSGFGSFLPHSSQRLPLPTQVVCLSPSNHGTPKRSEVLMNFYHPSGCVQRLARWEANANPSLPLNSQHPTLSHDSAKVIWFCSSVDQRVQDDARPKSMQVSQKPHGF